VEEVVAERADADDAPLAAYAPPCRLCAAPLQRTFVDLGLSPLANSYVEPRDLAGPETFYPLHVYVCEHCLLVQLPAAATPEAIFSDYAYFSSYSDSWVEHARAYTELVTERFSLDPDSFVVELASNDGYLLQHFHAKGVGVLGIEPAANVAEAAVARGIPTLVEFFGAAVGGRVAAEQRHADLVVGNNVLAHVPDSHDFVEGIARLLAPQGVVTMEFPHLLRLIDERQFDTIYHEHYSYFSFHTARRLFAEHGLRLFDVEQLPTHGGSLRIYGCHEAADHAQSERVDALVEQERAAELDSLAGHTGFGEAVHAVKRDLLAFLIEARRDGKQVVGYGAAAKGNTLLNFCGIREDLLDYVVDRSPHKQGRYLPGTRIPIRSPEELDRTRPDIVLILPWNLRDEIVEQMAHVRSWGCRFAVPVPQAAIVG
jgi:SAM-dependent methyltransferase